jgi:phthalate 4,5-dioxygenase oxygenase subunit
MTPEENDLLCRVEGDAPMGQIMRRHWIPACLPEEVAERDGKPVRVRLLGEDLVFFRDTNGRVGCLGEYCPHRRASLAFGRNEECGLRCLYHGWKFDVDGNALDMSSEPQDSRMRQHMKQTSYPTHEAAGFIWVWMGPAAEMPAFSPPAWAPTQDASVAVVRMRIRCNWAQVLEGAIDSAHSSSLHSTDMVGVAVETAQATDQVWQRPTKDKAPRMQAQIRGWGFRYAAIRKPLYNEDTHDYVRMTLFVAPFMVLIPPNETYKLAQAIVPVDDEHCWFNFIAWHETGGITTDAWRKFCAAERGPDLDENWVPLRTRENAYLQDRAAMKTGHDFTGIKGIPAQDMAMWESMGPIAHRWEERLGSSDLAIVQFRRQMLGAAQAYAEGGPAIGTAEPRLPQVKLASFEGVVPKSTDWRTLAQSDQELVMYGEKQQAAE